MPFSDDTAICSGSLLVVGENVFKKLGNCFHALKVAICRATLVVGM